MNNKNSANFKRQSLAVAISCIYMTLALAPVAYASDTEIYVNTVTSTAESAPTVMMVLDTSGSMQFCIDSTASEDCATDSKKRINVLRSALTTVLLGKVGATPETTIAPAPGFVKMGYARFNPDANKGGWVRYPARPLDAFVDISPNGSVNQYGLDGKSDTVQTLSTLNGNTLSTLTIDSASNVGLSFSNVMIPKGASVTEAYIELTASSTNNSSGEMLVQIEDNVNPADYTSVLVNSRTYASTVSPFIPANWVQDTKYTIPVDGLVEYMANKSSWCGGNTMNFRVSNKDALSLVKRQAYAFEAGATLKPRLFVRYTIDPNKTDSCIKTSLSSTFTPKVSSDDAYYYDSSSSLSSSVDSNLYVNYVHASAGRLRNIVRFPNVIIPQGATITSATLTGLSNSNSIQSGVKPINVEVYDADNITPLCTSTSCPKPTYSLSSSVSWPLTTIPKAPTRPSVVVTSLVQQIVNRTGWQGKNALAFRLSNSTTTNNDKAIFSAVDNGLSKAMNLSVSWTKEVHNLKELRTVREDILADLAFLSVKGGTPLGAAYAEASRYMLGMVPYVKNGTADFGDGEVYEVHDPRVLNTAKTQFVSPVETGGCSGNYIFMMSDGEPNNLANVGSNSKEITGVSCGDDSSASVAGTGKSLNWKCMFDVAAWNLRSDNQIKVPVHSTTVYFGPTSSTNATDNATIVENIANMKTVATKGDGDAFQATDEAKLVDALTQTIKKAVDAGGNMTAPGVAVNQLNRLNHLDQLYYAVFDPKPNAYRWGGNVKRYRLGSNGTVIYDNSATPIDAVDSSTGFFKKTAKSFWSDAVDGDVAIAGGAASKIPVPNSRKMFTYMGAMSAKNTALTLMDTTNASFNAAAQTATGVTGTVYTNLMNWYKGYEVPDLNNGLVDVSTTDLRQRLGAALHSQPLLINYGFTGTLADAGNPDNQKNYLFFSTLEGSLHAVEAKTGIEKFSFIPGEKLSNLKSLFDNPSAVLPQFGMDLTWTYFRKDSDSTGQIGTGDKIYLYGGMRMGGDDYYALDVTDLTAPKLLFAVDGGTGKYANMGQSWSQPVVTTVKIAGANRKVLVFGGGYDPRHEGANEIFTGNDKGNQVYMLDAFTGDLLWFASGNSGDSPDKYVADMKYSVPSGIQAVDVDGDGVTDAFYFGDLGGQVFRIDMDKTSTASASAAKRVRLIASVGQTESATAVNQRRFYEQPKAAIFTDVANQKFATIAIGSGYRSHPLNTVTKDRFFVLFDYDLPRADLGTADDSSLKTVIATTDLVSLDMASTTVKTSGVDVTNKRGWYVDLPESGEKSLASGLIFQSKLVFTTYAPKVSTVSSCSPITGSTGVYTFCMPYGKLCSNTPNYFKDNVMLGLGGEPQILVVPETDATTGLPTGNSKAVVLIGTGIVGGIFDDVGQPVLTPAKKWREKTRK